MQDHPDTGGPEFRPPPPEADRLWRHPSEVRTGGRPHPAARPPRRRSTTAPGTAAVAAALGSLVTIAAVTSAGLLAPIGALLAKDSTTTTAPTPALHMAVVVHVETAAGASEYAGIALHEHDAVVVAAEPGVIGPDSTAWVAQFQGSTQSRSLDAAFAGADPQTGAVAFRVPGLDAPTVPIGPAESGLAITASIAGSRRASVTGSVASTATRVEANGGPVHGVVQITTNAHVPMDAVVTDAAGTRLVGVISAADDHFGDRVSYMLPAATAQQVGSELVQFGTVRHVSLGASLVTVRSGVDGSPAGAISAIEPGGAVDRAGLLPGDVLVSLGGMPVHDGMAAHCALMGVPTGGRVDAVVERNAQRSTVRLTFSDGADLAGLTVTSHRP